MADENEKRHGEVAEESVSKPRFGQLASERSAFDTGRRDRVLAGALGEPPPGYGLTFVRGYTLDPRTVVAVWDVNDAAHCRAGDEAGWERIVLRVVTEGGASVTSVPVGTRSGTYRVDVARAESTIVLELLLARRGASDLLLARSPSVRIPPTGETDRAAGAPFVAVPAGVDLRRLLGGEPPPPCGHRFRPDGSAERLRSRLRHAARHAASPRTATPADPSGAPRAPRPATRGESDAARGSDGSGDDDVESRPAGAARDLARRDRRDDSHGFDETGEWEAERAEARSLAWALSRVEPQSGTSPRREEGDRTDEGNASDDASPAAAPRPEPAPQREGDGDSERVEGGRGTGATSPRGGFSMPTSPSRPFSITRRGSRGEGRR